MQSGYVQGARRAAQRSDEHGQPGPWLAQDPLRPVVLLRPLVRVASRRDSCLPPAMQAAGQEQEADHDERYPDDQIQARAGRALRRIASGRLLAGTAASARLRALSTFEGKPNHHHCTVKLPGE